MKRKERDKLAYLLANAKHTDNPIEFIDDIIDFLSYDEKFKQIYNQYKSYDEDEDKKDDDFNDFMKKKHGVDWSTKKRELIDDDINNFWESAK